ncbi:MAG: biopolymer transporter ExbD [Lentisphaeria bacterium]|nr:biopolymer transporter ExbD [Lentisphaeria bacterium]
MARSKRRRGRKVIDNLDVTPLVDLTFILLVVFMLTAPVLENSIKVKPPEMNAGDIKSSPDNRVVIIDKSESIFYQDQLYALPDLVAVISDEYQRNPKLQFFIRGDQEVSYGAVLKVLSTLKEAGVDQAGLITEVPSR